MSRSTRFLVAVTAVAALAGCTESAPSDATVPVDARDAVRAEASTQPPDLVDVTVYFRRGHGAAAYLVPVKREVPVTEDLPRRALQLLLAGPVKADPSGLRAPLPTSTEIDRFFVRKGIATVNLSPAAVAAAGKSRKPPQHEVMAIAAVSNTLTEFPHINRVRLGVTGRKPHEFWGAWGLPRILVRDTSVLEPPRRGTALPPLDGFSRRNQRVGVVHRNRQPTVGAVRVQAMSTYLRVTVEVLSHNGGNLRGPVPLTRADRRGKQILLRVRGKARQAVVGDLSEKISDPLFPAARVDIRAKPREVVTTIRPRHRREFWLHTLSEPARVVLDIRR